MLWRLHARGLVRLAGRAARVAAAETRVPRVEALIVHVDALVLALPVILRCPTVPAPAEGGLTPL